MKYDIDPKVKVTNAEEMGLGFSLFINDSESANCHSHYSTLTDRALSGADTRKTDDCAEVPSEMLKEKGLQKLSHFFLHDKETGDYGSHANIGTEHIFHMKMQLSYENDIFHL